MLLGTPLVSFLFKDIPKPNIAVPLFFLMAYLSPIDSPLVMLIHPLLTTNAVFKAKTKSRHLEVVELQISPI